VGVGAGVDAAGTPGAATGAEAPLDPPPPPPPAPAARPRPPSARAPSVRPDPPPEAAAAIAGKPAPVLADSPAAAAPDPPADAPALAGAACAVWAPAAASVLVAEPVTGALESASATRTLSSAEGAAESAGVSSPCRLCRRVASDLRSDAEPASPCEGEGTWTDDGWMRPGFMVGPTLESEDHSREGSVKLSLGPRARIVGL